MQLLFFPWSSNSRHKQINLVVQLMTDCLELKQKYSNRKFEIQNKRVYVCHNIYNLIKFRSCPKEKNN